MSARPALEIADVSRRYGDVVAVDGLSLTVAAGQLCGFVGPNGAGKTTTMRMVLGVVRPDRGEIRWAGRPIDAEVRRRFGYMPEERGLYPKMAVDDQLAYFGRLHGLRGPEAARAATSWIERLGLDPHAKDRVEKLSLGNQQRVQLAVALVHEPELLVLDEPFSGLDPMGVDTLAEVLAERVDAGAAVLFSSHQLDLVERLCDSVAIVNEGRVATSGPVRELRAASRRRVLSVRVDGARAGWWDAVPGVACAGDRAAESTHLVLEEDVDEQVVLDVARRAGRVTAFGFEMQSLASLFRDVLSEPPRDRAHAPEA